MENTPKIVARCISTERVGDTYSLLNRNEVEVQDNGDRLLIDEEIGARVS
jgi:hypothetical protein